jgi:hypothetical protein
MKRSHLSLVSTMAVLGLLAVGCTAKVDGTSNGTSDGTLGTDEAQLVDDNSEASQNDDNMESGVEEPLSGADPTDPGTPPEATSDADLQAKVKLNVGKWFRPAGCISTTFAGNVATHVFKGCTGPYGLVSFDGTVTTTYERSGDMLTVTFEANGFKANGASISGKRVVVYTRNGSVVTKHRTGNWTGTTKNGKDFSHTADFTATWDGSTKCITRDGSAETTIAAREFSHSITGFKRCGIGMLGCPESGKIVLERTKGGVSASVTIEFLGGRSFTVTGPKGNTVTRQLICNPN